MALDLKTTIHTENDCKTLVITDITKPRSSANINGWGGQNASPDLAKINLVLTIIYPIIDGEDLTSSYKFSFNRRYLCRKHSRRSIL